MKKIKIITVSIILCFIIYLIGAFVEVSLDISLWNKNLRGLIGTTFAAIMIIGTISQVLYNEDIHV